MKASRGIAIVLMTIGFAAPAVAQGTDSYYEFLMAIRLEAQGNLDGALSALERAAAADPRSEQMRAEIASYYLRRNRRNDGEQVAGWRIRGRLRSRRRLR